MGAEPRIKLEADELHFIETNRLMEASSNVKLIYNDINIKADHIKLNVDTNTALSTGNIQIKRGEDTFNTTYLHLDLNKEIVLFCAAGGRSALAAKTLKEMGFKKVSHIEGGFGNMLNSGFKVIK